MNHSATRNEKKSEANTARKESLSQEMARQRARPTTLQIKPAHSKNEPARSHSCAKPNASGSMLKSQHTAPPKIKASASSDQTRP